MKRIILSLVLLLGLSSFLDSAIIYTYQILEVRIGAGDLSNKTVEAYIKYTAVDDPDFQKLKWITFVTTNTQALLRLKGEIDTRVISGQ